MRDSAGLYAAAPSGEAWEIVYARAVYDAVWRSARAAVLSDRPEDFLRVRKRFLDEALPQDHPSVPLIRWAQDVVGPPCDDVMEAVSSMFVSDELPTVTYRASGSLSPAGEYQWPGSYRRTWSKSASAKRTSMTSGERLEEVFGLMGKTLSVAGGLAGRRWASMYADLRLWADGCSASARRAAHAMRSWMADPDADAVLSDAGRQAVSELTSPPFGMDGLVQVPSAAGLVQWRGAVVSEGSEQPVTGLVSACRDVAVYVGSVRAMAGGRHAAGPSVFDRLSGLEREVGTSREDVHRRADAMESCCARPMHEGDDMEKWLARLPARRLSRDVPRARGRTVPYGSWNKSYRLLRGR